ncbi:hypothetical protein NZK35_06030 [Stieleria sp. ICT_E10.1]|uniref:hypothetical protein n=1 Tax=Stieleria sedimenti TaxID=2976331 RepID=UPI00217F734A|nr:hypothetical protein [Stieleria sedimenti]MCS7466233.1 hypothetical protein [Stieleria sedimenti]
MACLSVAPWASADVQAQQPVSTTHPGWNLRWRKSSTVTAPAGAPSAAAPQHQPQQDVFAIPPRPHQPVAARGHVAPAINVAPGQVTAARRVAQVGHHQPIANPMRVEQSNAFEHAAVSRSIRQAQYTAPNLTAPNTAAPVNGSAPVGNYRRTPTRSSAPPERLAQPNDFFNNPFAEGLNAPAQSASMARRADAPQRRSAPAARLALAPAPQTTGDSPAPGFSLPDLPTAEPPAADVAPPAIEQLPPNALRGSEADAQTLPAPSLPTPGQRPADQGSADDDSSMRDLLSDPNEQIQDADEAAIPAPSNTPDATEAPSVPQWNDPNKPQGDRQTDSPSDKGDADPGFFQNPFDQNRAEREQTDPQALAPQGRQPGDTSMLKANQLSCEDFRARIARETIDKISLDPSPPFRPDLFDPEDYQRQREKFESRQTSRPWSSIEGRVIATGRFLELAYEKVIIETDDGGKQELPIERLSEGDLGYLSENWGLPKECLIEQVAYTPRSWAPLTMTWKASNLCSKPRYFEQVNLERYGHTAGPLLQPVVSSAHFFANIAVLPYKMGIHPPNECQYALGYYRPGNCAPWIVPPVPISARGALVQGATMTGAFWLIP